MRGAAIPFEPQPYAVEESVMSQIRARQPKMMCLGLLLMALPVVGCVRPSEIDDHEPTKAAPAPLAKVPLNTTISIAWLPETVTRHRALLESAGKLHKVDPEVLAIITLVESGGWVSARSSSGARGLMQVMPATGKQIASDRGKQGHRVDKLDQPAYNIDFGSWYLARQLETFGAGKSTQEAVRLAAAAYNGGPGRLRRSLDGDDVLRDETKRYRIWVGGMYQERRATSSATFEAWLKAGGDRLIAKAKAEMRAASKTPSKPAAER